VLDSQSSNPEERQQTQELLQLAEVGHAEVVERLEHGNEVWLQLRC
jgi:hypothetical protein